MNLYYIFRHLAFRLDPEAAHCLALSLASYFPRFCAGFFPTNISPRLNVSLGKMNWHFPVGLAAGLDKDGIAVDFFSRLYFGAIEVGTVTPLPQEGNPKPRLFRLIKDESLHNAMGFNSSGSDKVLENIKRSKHHGKIIGVNLGKNKDTDDAKTPEDYLVLYKKFASVADYLVINVSSPNTPGLREFQHSEKLRSILDALKDGDDNTPLFVKISPNLEAGAISSVVNIVKEYNLAGIIATNSAVLDGGHGGFSGKIIKEKAEQVRNRVLEELRETSHIHCIGAGGIYNFDDILNFWRKGGRAVQIYTSFVYHGPHLLKDIAKDMELYLDKHDLKDVNELLDNINNL